jgi:hypothetical protein
LGLDFLLEMSQNQAPHSSRPSTSGKACVLCSAWFCGVRRLRPGRFSGTTCIIAWLCRLPLGPCSFVRDSNARRVPVTPPIVLKLQGLPARKRASGRAYHCWPHSPHLTCYSACAEGGALRATHERFFG